MIWQCIENVWRGQRAKQSHICLVCWIWEVKLQKLLFPRTHLLRRCRCFIQKAFICQWTAACLASKVIDKLRLCDLADWKCLDKQSHICLVCWIWEVKLQKLLFPRTHLLRRWDCFICRSESIYLSMDSSMSLNKDEYILHPKSLSLASQLGDLCDLAVHWKCLERTKS